MAASIYATPPPDLSSEDTALSDVSNSSTLNTNRSNNNNTHEATTAAAGGAGGGAAAGNHSPTEQLVKGGELERETSQSPKTLQKPAGSSTNEADNAEDDEDVATEAGEATAEGGVEDGAAAAAETEMEMETEEGASNMAAMAAAAANAAAMQLQLLEALSDAAKKRRKQHNPSRLEALNLSGAEAQLEDRTRVDYEEKLSKMFLPKSMEKLKETFELLQQHKQEQEEQQQEEEESEHISEAKQQQQEQEQDQRRNPYQTYCKQCGENFETEFKLSLHMLQDHREGQQQERDVEPMDFLSSIKVKLEREESPNQLQLEQDMSNGHGREQEQDQEQEHWYNAMAQQQQQQQQQQLHPHGSALGPAFPFPPGMGPAGYLPLLGMSGFPGVDGLNRPPLRIFNPEAYCELCNKEFCNKYFLKTHKANKHGIFDPVGEPTANSTSSNNNNNTTSSNNNSNSGSSMSHMFQLQREAAAAPQPPPPPPPAPSSVAAKVDAAAPVANIHCDICSKRFTNIFAMRRHRAKQHEQAAAGAAADSSPNSQGQTRRGSPPIESQSIKQEAQPELELQARPQPFQLPEGFREDFTLEQEELNFVPPPRKLPAQLQQQARECASSAEKLRRLGVHFPEFYCELCHKEYANRYFLRTHKWKRHGVFVPPEELGKDEAQLSGWPFMPLNLMLAKAAAAASMEQAEQEHEQEPEQEPEAEQELSEQPSKRIKLEPDLEEEKLNGSSVMGLQNLQKLQSMLQQLNDINGKRPLPCHLCGRELENQYALRAHLMTEHAAQMQLPMGMPLQLPPHGMSMPLPEQQLPLHALYQQQAGPQTPPNAGARSSPGGGEEFKQHIAAPSASPLREGFYTPERPVAAAGGGTASGTVPVPPPNRPAYTITPTSSYCEICNKELCNKYFMKTHMQRMHGIEIENGAQIGGVVCNICNKELCSKYFLRVHKHNTHGIIEEGSPLPQPRGQNGVKLEAAAAAAAAQQAAPEQELNPTPPAAAAAAGGESNSGAAHEVCPLCARQFRSFKWLRSHLMNEHGPSGVERLREMEATPAAASGRSKPNSPTLKIPNGSSSGAPPAPPAAAATAGAVGNPPPNLAQALQNLNAQHLFGQMQQQVPKGMQGMPPLPPLPGMFGEQSQRFKEYQCSMCPFTTPYYAFLFIHERSHALLNSADGMEASLEAPPPPPAAARSQGKSRSKSNRAAAAPPTIEDAELHVEPTNLSTSKATTSHSPTQHTPGTPSPKAQSPLAAGKNRSPNLTGRRSSKSNTPNGIGGGHRSAATSPFEVCTDLANGTGKPASYAQPDRSEEAYQMQAFHLQPADADSEMQFAPALVYLPVRVRASETATLSFRLTPA